VRYSSPGNRIRLAADITFDKPYPPRPEALFSFVWTAWVNARRKPEVSRAEAMAAELEEDLDGY
jgi:hypothetical protein